MKKGWKIIPMGKLCSISSGESDTQDAVANGPYAFFDRSKTIKRSSRFLYDCEALIIPGEGKEFFPRHFKGKFDLHQRAYALFDFLPEIDVRFLYHLFYHRSEYFPSVAVGATVKSLRRRHFENFPVPLPPLPEQRRIVAILDEAFAAIAAAKATAENNLQNARALFESHLNEVFTRKGTGWNSKPFEDCIEDIKYTAKVQRKNFLSEGKFPVVSQEADPINGYWNRASDLFKVSRPVVIFGDHTKVLKFVDFDFVLGADGVKILAPKPFLDTKFFFYHLRSVPLKSLGYSRHYRLLKELNLAYPDLTKQKTIVTQLDVLAAETTRLASLYEAKLAALEELKKSLLHQAFAGEL